jgi:hypothetical protein
MQIEFYADSLKVINCMVYLLMQKEMDILREFLTKEERKGYIEPRSSVACFFPGMPLLLPVLLCDNPPPASPYC